MYSNFITSRPGLIYFIFCYHVVVSILCIFLGVPCVGLQCVNVVCPGLLIFLTSA